MNHKVHRQKEVLKVVAGQDIATQAELRKVLADRGHRVDQATLSRDIRELGLVKIAVENGRYKYAPVEEASPVQAARSEGFVGRAVRTIGASKNLVVIKTD